jgi:hypothetical protein
MKRRLIGAALLLGMMYPAGAALAQAPAYSFETPLPAGPDGFFGLGATVTQEPTIGVTHLESSLKYEVGVGGFVGARTETLVPPLLNDPPGVSHILFDLTIVDPYLDTFADIGVTLFGHALNAPGGAQFGHQVQFANQHPMAGLAAGTHQDQRIDLDLSVGPYRPGESFNDIFGLGPNDLTVASAFQFFINKNPLTPITIYIDNVRLVVPEPASLGLAGLGGLAALRLSRRRQRAA